MSKSYYTYLSTIFLIHGFILLGTWTISQTNYVKAGLNKLESGVMKLQIASQVIMTPQVKPRPKLIPKIPNKTKPAPAVVEEVTTPDVTEPVETAQGSEFGNSAEGKTDIASLYKAELRARIDQNKFYPPLSRRLGQTGTVIVAFTLLEDGNIINIRIDKPSRYERLNISAMDAVKKVERFKPIPKELGTAEMDVKVPVKFVTI